MPRANLLMITKANVHGPPAIVAPHIIVISLALATLLVNGCAKRVHVARTLPTGHTETGIASWYGEPYHGRRTASGEIYDMERWTAAHRTMAFGTWVEVTNLTNAKKVQVRITDRGPFVGNRIIDLSRAAAKQIDMIGPGTALVRLRVIQPPNADVAGTQPYYAVQVASLTDRREAERMKHGLEAKKHAVQVVERDVENSTRWRVLVGRESSVYDATLLATSLRAEYPDALVVLLDR